MRRFSEGFYHALLAEFGILTLALVYDGEFVAIAIGLLAGIPIGRGSTFTKGGGETATTDDPRPFRRA